MPICDDGGRPTGYIDARAPGKMEGVRPSGSCAGSATSDRHCFVMSFSVSNTPCPFTADAGTSATPWGTESSVRSSSIESTSGRSRLLYWMTSGSTFTSSP